MEKAREIAVKAAQSAGQLIKERMGDIGKIDYKSAFNLVTDVDKASEQVIIKIVRDEFPNDEILAEESGATQGHNTNRRWLIDPIDGTTNFAHSYPFFCVSIGLEEAGKLVMGVVFNPISNELFWAQTGKGAWLNDKPIKVSKVSRLDESLVCTGLFHAATRDSASVDAEVLIRMANTTHGIRRDGSAALDLCFVACGRTEVFWERQLSLWDMGAGTVIIREAGGQVTDLDGKELDLTTIKVNILASNKLIHEQMIEALSLAPLAKK